MGLAIAVQTEAIVKPRLVFFRGFGALLVPFSETSRSSASDELATTPSAAGAAAADTGSSSRPRSSEGTWIVGATGSSPFVATAVAAAVAGFLRLRPPRVPRRVFFLTGGDDSEALGTLCVALGRGVDLVAFLHVREAVVEEREDIGRDLLAETITGAEILVDPDLHDAVATSLGKIGPQRRGTLLPDVEPTLTRGGQ